MSGTVTTVTSTAELKEIPRHHQADHRRRAAARGPRRQRHPRL